MRDAVRGDKLRADIARAGCRSVTTPQLDLASLGSVKRFLDDFSAADGGGQLGGVLLNAGVQSAGELTRTADDIESTFAVNHLAHHLLLTGLLPHLASDAIIGWTASGTHDPAERMARL